MTMPRTDDYGHSQRAYMQGPNSTGIANRWGEFHELPGVPTPTDPRSTREEVRAWMRQGTASFGTDPNVMTLGQAAFAAVTARGWLDSQTQGVVKAWQAAHSAAGNTPAITKIDGKYGPESAAALRADLSTDVPPPFYTGSGAVAAIAATTAAPALSTSAPSVQAQSAATLTLAQAALTVLLANGAESPEAQDAVMAWQRARGGLDVDGVYGDSSARALSNDLQVSVPPALPPGSGARLAALRAQKAGKTGAPSPSHPSQGLSGLTATVKPPPASASPLEKAKFDFARTMKEPAVKTVLYGTLGLALAATAWKLFGAPKKSGRLGTTTVRIPRKA